MNVRQPFLKGNKIYLILKNVYSTFDDTKWIAHLQRTRSNVKSIYTARAASSGG